MHTDTFNDLVQTLEPQLARQHTNCRPPICPEQLVAICLRFLATGDSFCTIAFSFRVGVSTVHYAVQNVCDAIWDTMYMTYLPPLTTDKWLKVADRFEAIWNFPHCVGALDGKHVVIQAPPNSGSQFYNYKGTFSIVLLALVDADYNFLAVDIGDFGSNSDGGVFARSELGKAMTRGKLGLPQDKPIGSAPALGPLPYVVIADEAFPLTSNLLRPYPGRGLSDDRRVFNYRLSRARRIVESAFGILAQRWRIYQRRLNLYPENLQRVVKATVILHNMLQQSQPLTHTDDSQQTGSAITPLDVITQGRGV